MHLAQAKTRLPEARPDCAGRRVHWRLGYLLFFFVGLYFPLNFTRYPPISDFFLQIVQILEAIILLLRKRNSKF